MPNSTSKVFFASLGSESFGKLIRQSGILGNLSGNVAVKLHLGEAYSRYTVAPEYVSVAISALKAVGFAPFLTDTTALYHGTRSTEKDYLKTAAKNGYANLGAPLVIADGDGKLETSVDGDFFLAKRILEADSMLVLTHCKGHVSAGFGGAIKNLAMGCASKAGKRSMHDFPKPEFSTERCTGCGLCVMACPMKAVGIEDARALLDSQKCISCGACLRACMSNAIWFPMGDPSPELQKRLAQYARAVVKSLDGKIAYVNFLNNVSKYCDCMGPSEIVAPDVGILASTDPVAIDAASYSLLSTALKDATGMDGSVQITAAETLGLGKTSYELIRL